MSVKISELTSVSPSTLTSVTTAIIPVVAGNVGLITYQTSLANIKTVIQTGDFSATGNVVSAGDFLGKTISLGYANLGGINGNVTVNVSSAAVQNITTNGNVNLLFTGWPANANIRVSSIGLTVTNANFKLTLPSTVTNANGVVGYDYTANTISFPKAGNYGFGFSSGTNGAALSIDDSTNYLLRPFNNTTQVITANTDVVDLGSTYTVYNPAVSSTSGNATLANGVPGLIKVITSRSSSTFKVNVPGAGWNSGSGNLTINGSGPSVTLAWLQPITRWVVVGTYGNVTFA